MAAWAAIAGGSSVSGLCWTVRAGLELCGQARLFARGSVTRPEYSVVNLHLATSANERWRSPSSRPTGLTRNPGPIQAPPLPGRELRDFILHTVGSVRSNWMSAGSIKSEERTSNALQSACRKPTNAPQSEFRRGVYHGRVSHALRTPRQS